MEQGQALEALAIVGHTLSSTKNNACVYSVDAAAQLGTACISKVVRLLPAEKASERVHDETAGVHEALLSEGMA